MPGKDKLGDKVGIVTGNGHGAARRIWTGAAECEHAETNQRDGEKEKVASRGGCQDNAARRVCHAGWQLSGSRWVVYLPQQSRHAVP